MFLAQHALALLANRKYNLSAKHIIDIIQVIAPRRVAGKRGLYYELQDLYSQSTDRAKELNAKLHNVQETLKKKRARRRRNVSPATPREEGKKAGGFQSRVGAMLKKRPKRTRKPRKKSKPRKAKAKPVKKEVKKPEPVMEPKKVIEIPPSPKIKKTKPAGKFPDFVRKRRNKKYLN